MNEQTITCPSCKTENHMRTVSAGTGTSCCAVTKYLAGTTPKGLTTGNYWRSRK